VLVASLRRREWEKKKEERQSSRRENAREKDLVGGFKWV
jgi:hypothetical protein